ncbi:MAG: SIMPL domain-containing protein [Actinomycetes bacterium]
MRMQTKRILAIALSGALLTGIGLTGAQAADRYINVSATGSVKVTPDTVRINASVSFVGTTSSVAQSTSAATASAIRAALKSNGVDAQYIKSQNLTIYPEYNYTTDKGSVLIGYRASQSFEIIVRNAKNAGTVVDAIVAAGADKLNLDGVTPYVFDNTTATNAARTDAITRAKAKAAHYAKLLGVKLSSVTSLDETTSPSPYPIMMATAKMDSGATQIDLGQQDVSVSVAVKWAIK